MSAAASDRSPSEDPAPMSHPVTVIPGDGVGPEVVRSAVRIIDAAGVPIDWEWAEAGAEVFKRGDSSGVPKETRESLERTRVALKGPLETPVGFGEKSANVTLRKLFETYANVRPARELPGVPTRYSGEGIDFVVVRENIEDLYAGIEHMQTPDVGQALKIVSRKGSEKVIRYAFELARREGRLSVTCATKANILKLTEGLFKRVFEEVAPDYPEIEARHIIVDNAAHQLAKDPAQFDVLVMTNMNGDILSDLASGLVGGLGFAASGNFGDDVAIFEAVHGSAPKYAGKDVINPTALILSAVLMLRHIGEAEAADAIEGAVFSTLASGAVMTQDLARQTGGDAAQAASTTAFTDAVIANLGQRGPAIPGRPRREPSTEPPRPRWSYTPEHYAAIPRVLVGMDVMIEADGDPVSVGTAIEVLTGDRLKLKMISSRGTKVYPADEISGSDDVRWWRCRIVGRDGVDVTDADLVDVLGRISGGGFRWSQVERLQSFDGEAGYSKAQGE
jgi:isocitrate dehydrogenase